MINPSFKKSEFHCLIVDNFIANKKFTSCNIKILSRLLEKYRLFWSGVKHQKSNHRLFWIIFT
jgi:replication initiation and membrane attachment protein DnaB